MIRKSEQNSVILNTILSYCDFDVSLNAENVLLEALKDSYGSEKYGVVCCKIAQNMLTKIKNVEVLSNCVIGLKSLINGWHDE